MSLHFTQFAASAPRTLARLQIGSTVPPSSTSSRAPCNAWAWHEHRNGRAPGRVTMHPDGYWHATSILRDVVGMLRVLRIICIAGEVKL